MDSFVERIYLEELHTQCAWAISAVERMNELLQSDAQDSTQAFFRQSAALLQHAGLASKIIWPPGSPIGFKNKRAKVRSRHLRTVLDVSDDHVLKDRRLRDHFEHYDERLDDWVNMSPNRIMISNVIGPRNAIGGNVVQDHEIFKLFDPATNRLVFRGESFDIQVLVNGLVDLRSRARIRILDLANVA